ncbi:MAG: 2-isopropylmalate synthase [Candidatus Omnitrophica bacterium CG1_02_46_14]|nr:MAG: 2-isopropylmalate synthase [Candidatus Omnitrophica bacterium CG1_02_46_14]
MNDKNRIFIFDTTLRDGEQSPGASLDEKGKLEIAKQLADLRVDIIEAGFPVASPGDAAAVKRIAKEVKGPTICALARAIQKDIDIALESLKPARNSRLHIFLATSEIHRKYKLNKATDEILRIATSMVKYARGKIGEVEFSPEDASRTEPSFLYQVLESVIDAGATVLNIPDTVGYATPFEFGNLIKGIYENVPNINRAIISVHCHNDLGLAVANSLSAITFGASQVECTINGIGERAGNAAMEEIVMALDTRKDIFQGKVTRILRTEIIKTSRLVSSLTGMMVQSNKAVVGKNAFTHESGIHQDGLLKFRKTYEIMRPEDVGLVETQLVLGKHSGRHALHNRLTKLGYKLSSQELNLTFQNFKVLADKKKEVFDEDLVALVDKEVVTIPKICELLFLSVLTASQKKSKVTLKIKFKSKVLCASGTGSGPVDAAYKLIDKMLNRKTRLLDYQIHSVTVGKDAQGEVTVKIAGDGGRVILGQGLSTDVIEASVKAYLNAINKIVYQPRGSKKERLTYGV